MSLFSILYISMYFAVAAALSVGLVLALGVGLHMEQRLGGWVVPSLAPLIALAITFSTITSHRNLKFAATQLDLISEGSGNAGWILRFITIAILLICLARMLGHAMRRQSLQLAPGTSLFVAFACFFVASNVLPSAFGTKPDFVHNMFYPIFIFAAAWVARREPLKNGIAAAKWAVWLMMLLSVVLMKVKPDMVMETNYAGAIPGLSIRLWGVGSNANSIGPLALLYLMLEYLQPTGARWLRWSVWRWIAGRLTPSLTRWGHRWLRMRFVLWGLAVFILAQSKTAWVVAGAVALVLMWYRWGRMSRGRINPAFALLVIAGGILLVLLLFKLDQSTSINRLSLTQTGQTIETFSGRMQIWQIAFDEWLRSPIFGYGPDIWGPAFRSKIDMSFAFSAHNQFMQSLSAAGLIGLISLLAYLAVAIKASLRMADQTRGVSVALMLMMLARCMTETPLDVSGLFNGDVLIHFVWFMILLRVPAPEIKRRNAVNVAAGMSRVASNVSVS